MTAPSTAGRRSNPERRASMQERLLRAAVECLRESGYARTTTAAVQEAAGVSRGALLHHYRSRQELLVAAVAHLAAERAATLRERARSRPADAPDGGLSAWLGDLWDSFDSPLFSAVLELWIASRTDPALREALLPHEREVRASIVRHGEASLAPEVLAHEGFGEALEMTLLYLRGLALTGIATGSRGTQAQSLAAWEGHLVARLVPGAVAQAGAARRP